MGELTSELSFGRMAVALGFLDQGQFGEAMYLLGSNGSGVDIRQLVLDRGWMDAAQADAVQEALDGEAPGTQLWGDRYELREELGQGAFGQVFRAWDQRIGRQVAIKTLKPRYRDDRTARARFLFEAQIAGQLTHPNIIPVYEIGSLPGGGLYYAMEEVEGHSLQEVLDRLQTGDADTVRRYPLPRLVGYLRQACRAVAYAHAQGVIHRDLKPHNLMVGPFGEVFVLDWGSAKLVDPDGATDRASMEASMEIRISQLDLTPVSTVAGKIKGTPAYMAPEQARADAEHVGPATDLYALGGVLYAILCLRPPFSGANVDRVLERVLDEPPVPPRSRESRRPIPAELEEIALSCLVKDAAHRPSSVEDLIRDLNAYLEGTQRRDEAAAYLRDAETALERYEDLRVQSDRLDRVTREEMSRVAPWAPVDRKRRAWRKERELRNLRHGREEAFNLALMSYQRALGFDADNAEARRGLARLYWQKFEDAEGRGDEEATEFFRAQVLGSDDGRYRREFSGMASAAIQTDPPGAEAVLHRYEEQDRVMVPSLPRPLGKTPTAPVRLAQGSYVVTLQTPGYADVHLPLFSNRPGSRRYRITLRRTDEIGEDFVVIPGGRFLQGGDPRVPQSWPRQPVYVPDFAIGRHPVTLGQYMAFVEELAQDLGRAALARAPRTDARGKRLIRWDSSHGRPELMERAEYGDDWQRWPVFSISFDDAQAYAEWRARKENRPLRLPTAMEWEKAARGVDGRLFPWGDVFEPTYCNCRTSREDRVSLLPAGSFPEDASPYGVVDQAGGVMEWVEDDTVAHPQLRVVRGGAWNRGEVDCCLAAGRLMPLWTTGTAIGMRLAFSLMGTLSSPAVPGGGAVL